MTSQRESPDSFGPVFCWPQLHSPPTRIPSGLRNRLCGLLRGPPSGRRRSGQRCCLFALGRIGDFVLSVSVLRLLVREFGAAHCTVVTSPQVETLASRELPGVRCITLPVDAPSLLRDIVPIWRRERPKLGADHFERLICFSHQRSIYYELALSWIGSEHELRLTPETYPQAPPEGQCAELLAHWRVAEIALGRTLAREDILPRLTSLKATDDGSLLVCPFSLDPIRNLPGELAVETLRMWRERSRAPITLGGSPADAARLADIAAVASAAGIDDIRIDTPVGLDGLLRQVSSAGALFSGDSAPAHIAAALDKPSVVVTSRSFFGFAQPWSRSDRQQVFVHGTPAAQVAAALPAL